MLNFDLRIILLLSSMVLSVLFFPYGFSLYYLLYKTCKCSEPHNRLMEPKAPVTIQLPIFNERYVIDRLVNACTQMADHYGKNLVQILILDDSTDDTTAKAFELEDLYKKEGYDIKTIHRVNRDGYKAGALQNALRFTKYDFLAVFDADYAPSTDFLNRTIPHFEDQRVGVVQCRWTHLNRNYNGITRAIALGIDGHFLCEQSGRYASGLLFNFNGAAGVIRRKALEEAGGWESDTLAEDLDASFRIQLNGWKAVYLNSVECPAEVPPTIPAAKRQQSRWASGSIQTFRKLGLRLLRSRTLTLKQKVEGLIHLSYYMIHPFIFTAFLIALIGTFSNVRLLDPSLIFSFALREKPVEPLTIIAALPYWIFINFLIVLCTLSTWIFYSYAIRLQGMRLRDHMGTLIFLAFIGFGISVSNTIAVFQGMFSKATGNFARTPKYKIEAEKDTWRDKAYQIQINKKLALEITLGLTGALAILYALVHGNYGIVPILFVYTTAYLWTAKMTVNQSA